MAWIETTPESDQVRRALEQATPRGQQTDAILAVHGPNLAGLEAHLALYRSAMAPSADLSALDRELIAVVVSQANHCRY